MIMGRIGRGVIRVRPNRQNDPFTPPTCLPDAADIRINKFNFIYFFAFFPSATGLHTPVHHPGSLRVTLQCIRGGVKIPNVGNIILLWQYRSSSNWPLRSCHLYHFSGFSFGQCLDRTGGGIEGISWLVLKQRQRERDRMSKPTIIPLSRGGH